MGAKLGREVREGQKKRANSSAICGPTGTKLGREVGVILAILHVTFIISCMPESQGGNPIGKALVWEKGINILENRGNLKYHQFNVFRVNSFP